MRESKWDMYVKGMQMHHSVCSSTQSIDTIRFITEMIPPEKYNKILDIGVGEGLETELLRQLGYTPTGIITGEDNKIWARDHYKDIEFVDCDMHDLPFKSGTFDAIYTNQVFEHAYAPFIFLLECFCVLKRGGLMYVCTPRFEERHSNNEPNDISAQYISHHHPSVLSPNTYRQMFEKTGFMVIRQDDASSTFLLQRGHEAFLHGDVQGIIKQRDLL